MAWHRIPAASLAPGPDTALVQTAAVTSAGDRLLGGVVVDLSGTRQVAIWESPRPMGPWARTPMAAVAGRDGPNETIFSIAGGAGEMAAFGYRRSPTEGYPRPSTWISPAGPGLHWREILESREFLGGPDIIGFANLTYGPHGFTLAGTWTDARAGSTLAVWRSPDGVSWTRDSTEPSFDGTADQIPGASGVADSPAGLLLAGTIETPVPTDPGRQEGGLWYSAMGQSWSRLALSADTEPAASSTTFDALAAVPGGWIVVGTERTGSRTRPVAWTVEGSRQVSRPIPLPNPAGGDFRPLAIAVDGKRVLVVGSSGDRSVVWTSAAGWPPSSGWKVVKGPAPTGFTISSASVSPGRSGIVLVLSGSEESDEWWTP